MKQSIIGKAFTYIWSLWAVLSTCTIILLLFPVLVLAVLSHNARIIYWAHFMPPAAARVCVWLAGIRLDIRHAELIDAEGQYIYVSNHRSYLDALVAGAVIPNYIKFLGKAEILKWPVLGYLLDKFYVPVRRNDKENRAWSMEQMAEKVKTGASFFICPEGTCNTTTDFLTRFYDGAFRLSAENNIPLVPLTFVGTGELMPRNGFMVRPGKVIVYWHAAIPASSFDLHNIADGKNMVQDIMRQDLLMHYPDGKYEAS